MWKKIFYLSDFFCPDIFMKTVVHFVCNLTELQGVKDYTDSAPCTYIQIAFNIYLYYSQIEFL